MITRVEALDFRCLRYISQPIGNFEVLVGPNSSGKSSFLDVVAFLADLTRAGPVKTIFGDPRLGIPARATDPRQLVWMQADSRFQLAIEATIPENHPGQQNGTKTVCRYEVEISFESGEVKLPVETLWLKPVEPLTSKQGVLFPEPLLSPKSIVRHAKQQKPSGWAKVVSRGEDAANATFHAETSDWQYPFRLGPGRSALDNLPEDEEKFPAATWFKQLLVEGVQRIMLSSEAMRLPSAPGMPRGFLPDGSNLPWVVHELEKGSPDRLRRWVEHVRTALPDLESIRTVERPEDRRRYLVLRYSSGLEAPSWIVSDGTLRLLALTLLAYVPGLVGTFLIEEPENGIHPSAVGTVFDALSGVYSAQILCATHSPLIVGLASPDLLLCFARLAEGATAIVRGADHPRLKEWKGEVDLGTYFASGILA